MKYSRRERMGFVFLTFMPEAGKSDPLTDLIAREAMLTERLRPVSHGEFQKFHAEVDKPKVGIVAFGNLVHGPAQQGSFIGVPYLDVDGEVKISYNWVRGDELDPACDFIFASQV